MIRVKKSIEINRPPDQVFDLLTDLDRLQQWIPAAAGTSDVSDHPIRRGTTFRERVQIDGRTLDTPWHVAEIDRPHQLVLEGMGPGHGQVTVRETVEPDGTWSRVNLEFDYEPPGDTVGNLVTTDQVLRRGRREAEHALGNLKRLAEQEPDI